MGTNVYPFTVEEDVQDGLRGAGVIAQLVREPDRACIRILDLIGVVVLVLH